MRLHVRKACDAAANVRELAVCLLYELRLDPIDRVALADVIATLDRVVHRAKRDVAGILATTPELSSADRRATRSAGPRHPAVS